MSSAKNSDIQSEIDELYGKMYMLNDLLLQRSEKTIGEGEIYSAVDIFDFYISSHAMAYLKYLYIGGYVQYFDIFKCSLYFGRTCSKKTVPKRSRRHRKRRIVAKASLSG